jgi:phosphoenolpyruvate carboxykinase (ATP)
VPDIDRHLLDPRSTWKHPEAYDLKAAELAEMFRANFEKFTAAGSTLASAGPVK